jgi:hypothetical protein
MVSIVELATVWPSLGMAPVLVIAVTAIAIGRLAAEPLAAGQCRQKRLLAEGFEPGTPAHLTRHAQIWHTNTLKARRDRTKPRR